MSVESKPLENGKVVEGRGKRKPSAVISRASLVKQRGGVERLSAWGVLILSALGTVVAFHGGWAPVLALQFSIAAVVGGLLAQGVLTWLQWAYGDRKTSLQYLGSLAVDTALTTWGFGPLVAPILAPPLAERGIPEPMLASWFVVAAVALLIAWYPDNRLVD